MLLNVVLAYIHSLFLNTDKAKIREETLKTFDLAALKSAHKDIFTYLLPDKHYGYNGPRVSDREKSIHAFDEIYTKIQEADAKKSVTFACPSGDLRLLPVKHSDNHAPCTEKFNNMQRQINEMSNNLQLFLLSAQEKSNTNVMANRPPTVQTYRPHVPSTPARSRVQPASSTPLRQRAQSVKRSREASSPQDAMTDVTQYEDALAGD